MLFARKYNEINERHLKAILKLNFFAFLQKSL